MTAADVGSHLNSELTILFSCIDEMERTLDRDDPVRTPLALMKGAAQRCAWDAGTLLGIARAPVDALEIARAMIEAIRREERES